MNDVMQQNVLTVKAEDSIIELAQQMLAPKPKVYPVIDDTGMLVGIISRRNVLAAMDKQLQSCYQSVANH